MKQRNRLLLFVVLLLTVSIPLTIYLAITDQLILIQKKATGPAATVALYLPTFPENITYEQEFRVNVGIDTPDSRFSSVVVSLVYDTASLELVDIATDPGFDYLGDDPSAGVVKTFSILSKNPEVHTPGETLTPAVLTFRVVTENTPGKIRLDTSNTRVVGKDPTSGEDITLQLEALAHIQYLLPGPLCRVDMCTSADSLSFDTFTTTDKRYAVYLRWAHPGSSSDLFYKIYRNAGAPVPENHPENYFVAIASTVHSPTSQAPGYIDTNNGDGFAPDQELFYDIDTYALCSGSNL